MKGSAGGRPPVLVALAGLPGTGKSGLARALAGPLGAVMVDTDTVRRELPTPAVYTREARAAVYHACHARVVSALRAGRDVVFAAAHLQAWQRDPLVALAARCGARLLWVEVVADETTVLARLHRRQAGSDPHDHSDAVAHTYHELAAVAEPFAGPVLTVDTTHRRPDEAARQVLAALGLARPATGSAPAPDA